MSLCQIKRKPLYLSAALRAGLGQNGVYGLRMMWDTMGELRARFGADRNDGRDAERLAASFGPMRFVHLQRRDLVAQAVSRHKAEVSGTWHLGIEEAEHPTEPFYDFAQINAYLHEAVADNGAWAT